MGLAANPYDPVPLTQAGATSLWVNDRGIIPEVTVSRQPSFSWNGLPLDLTSAQETPFRNSPFLMKLKEIQWNTFDRNFSLNIVRNNRLIATIPSGPTNAFDFLFQPGQQALFTVSSFIRLVTSWSLIIRWEIISLVDAPAYIPAEVKSEIENEPLELDVKEREVEIQPQYQARPKRKLTERIMSVFRPGRP